MTLSSDRQTSGHESRPVALSPDRDRLPVPASTTKEESVMVTLTAAEMVASAKSRVEALSAEQVVEEIAEGVALLVDLREPEERATAGVIPGAVHAPRGMIEFYADPTCPYHRPEFDPDARVILHCAAGSRSALAAVSLQELGYRNVAHLDGGFKGWIAAGQPIENI